MSEKVKREVTEKQRAGLAKGRAARAAKLKAKAEALALASAPVPAPDVRLLADTPAPVHERKANINYKKIGLCISGGLIILASILTGMVWMADPAQTFMGILTVLLFGGGLALIYMAFKNAGVKTSRPSLRYGQTKAQGPANSITVYAKKDPANPNHLLPDIIKMLSNMPGIVIRL